METLTSTPMIFLAMRSAVSAMMWIMRNMANFNPEIFQLDTVYQKQRISKAESVPNCAKNTNEMEKRNRVF